TPKLVRGYHSQSCRKVSAWHMPLVDLTGRTFGDWTVLRIGPAYRLGRTCFWLCRCNCGTKKNVLGQNLKNGRSRGCGCTRLRAVMKHGMRHMAFYKAWREMLSRCCNSNNQAWPNYGGRGIRVCDDWLDPAVFWRDMGPSYQEGLTIERIDNNGNYDPS